MSRFILVSGAWHAGWCWEQVVPLIAAAGHEVIAPDLHGMVGDAPASATIQEWGAQIADLAAAGAEPSIVVGHSRGGAVISAAAEIAPDSIERLVYVAAFLLADGQSLGAASAAHQRAEPVVVPGPAATLLVRPEAVRDTFFNRTDPAVAARAAARLTPEPMSSFTTPLRLTAERFGRVPRAYVECSDDHAVPLALQRAMQRAWPCDPVVTLDTDHSPFYSAPEELVGFLLSLATPP